MRGPVGGVGVRQLLPDPLVDGLTVELLARGQAARLDGRLLLLLGEALLELLDLLPIPLKERVRVDDLLLLRVQLR